MPPIMLVKIKRRAIGMLPFIVLCLGLTQSVQAQSKSMYLAPEGFQVASTLLPISAEEAQLEAKKWRALMSNKDSAILKAYRADSYLEYDLRLMGGVYSYFTGKSYYNYVVETLRRKDFVGQEFEDINCNYSRVQETLVVEQCAMPARFKKADSYGIQAAPVVRTYVEIRKDSLGIFSVKNKIYAASSN